MNKLLLLAGLSCSGKTELGLALQAILPEPWVFWSADRTQPIFPDKKEFVTLASDRKMVEGNLKSIAAYLEAGFNVIAELFIWSDDDLALAAEIFKSYQVGVVSLECPIEILEKRELERNTTTRGFARAQQQGPSMIVPADLVVHTDRHSPSELASSIASWLDSNPAFDGLSRRVED